MKSKRHFPACLFGLFVATSLGCSDFSMDNRNEVAVSSGANLPSLDKSSSLAHKLVFASKKTGNYEIVVKEGNVITQTLNGA